MEDIRQRTTAECRNHDHELWFPLSERPSAQPGIEKAKTICFSCPLVDACLEYAIEFHMEFGIWGGHTSRERQRLGMRRPTFTTKVRKRDAEDRSELVRLMADPGR